MTKEVDIWVTETADGVLIDSVGVANLNLKELRALIRYLREWEGRVLAVKTNIGSS